MDWAQSQPWEMKGAQVCHRLWPGVDGLCICRKAGGQSPGGHRFCGRKRRRKPRTQRQGCFWESLGVGWD